MASSCTYHYFCPIFIGFTSNSPSMSFSLVMTERRQLLRDQCLKKPPNPLFLQEADFTRFIVIEKLKLVFCFIPKVSCTTWKKIPYSAANNGENLEGVPHRRKLFSWLKDYSIFERQKILSTYYKAMFVGEPFARLASAYRDKIKFDWFKRFILLDRTKRETKKVKTPFSAFVNRVIETNATQLKNSGIEDQHWRSYEQICPCEVDYDFIGHFENLDKEAPTLLKIIGVDGYVIFPDYRPSKTSSKMLKYYSQLTIDEIFQLKKLFDLDFKLFGYDFPGPLEGILNKKGPSEESWLHAFYDGYYLWPRYPVYNSRYSGIYILSLSTRPVPCLFYFLSYGVSLSFFHFYNRASGTVVVMT